MNKKMILGILGAIVIIALAVFFLRPKTQEPASETTQAPPTASEATIQPSEEIPAEFDDNLDRAFEDIELIGQ